MPDKNALWLLPDEEDALFDNVVAAMEGTPRGPIKGTPDKAMNYLERRLQALEAELASTRERLDLLMQHVRVIEAGQAPMHKSRKCPKCHRSSMNVVAKGPHPEFATEGIEQHEIRCDQCGHHGQRLYDPSGFSC